MIAKLMLFPIILLTFLVTKNSFATTEIVLGQTKDMRFPNADVLEVSRKGIIDIIQSSTKDLWHITGLKSGVVVVTWQDRVTSKAMTQYISAVSPHRAAQNVRPFPRHYCDEPGIRCNEAMGHVSGETDSFITWIVFNRFCRKSKTCISLVTLSEVGKAKYVEHIESAIGKGYVLESMSSIPNVVGICVEKNEERMIKEKIDVALNGLVTEKLVSFSCQQQVYRGYVFRAWAFLVNESKASVQGIKQHLGSLGGLTRVSNHELLQAIDSLQKEGDVKLIGEPSMLLSVGNPAEVASGGEFRFSQSDRKPLEVWKKFGFTLKSTIVGTDHKGALIDYELLIEVPSGKDSLRRSEMKSTNNFGFNEIILLGESQVSSRFLDTESDIVFAKVPIIGPLFTHWENKTAHASLLFWGQISEHQQEQQIWTKERWQKAKQSVIVP